MASRSGRGVVRSSREVRQRHRAQIERRDGKRCNACGAMGVRLEADHVVNLAEHGIDHPVNMQLLCQPCHAAKTAREIARGIARRTERMSRRRPGEAHPALRGRNPQPQVNPQPST